jgi:hypothetical protein
MIVSQEGKRIPGCVSDKNASHPQKSLIKSVFHLA